MENGELFSADRDLHSAWTLSSGEVFGTRRHQKLRDKAILYTRYHPRRPTRAQVRLRGDSANRGGSATGIYLRGAYAAHAAKAATLG